MSQETTPTATANIVRAQLNQPLLKLETANRQSANQFRFSITNHSGQLALAVPVANFRFH